MDRRRIARLFMLVILVELVVLCCACAHILRHDCPGDDDCAICRCVRPGPRAACPLLPAAAVACAAAVFARAAVETAAVCDTPIRRKVRLND